MMEETDPLITGNIDDYSWICCEHHLLLEYNEISAPNSLNFYRYILSTEDNAFDDSAAPVIEITSDNDYMHILNDLSNK